MMKNENLLFIGRWNVTDQSAVTTAPGAFFHLAFYGEYVVLHFETAWMSAPYPHLWVSVDNGPWIETALDRHLRVQARDKGNHVVTVVFKSAIEMAHRWFQPLDGRVEFLGYDAAAVTALEDYYKNKKKIEFIGDSITEGVLIDEALGEGEEWLGRPYQDDAMATYAWLTAMALGMDPIIMGYGSVGVTKGGSGSVPKVSEAYPYCYSDTYYCGDDPDYIVVNHGTNDQLSSSEAFMEEYRGMLEMILLRRRKSRVFIMIPFCGVFKKELVQLADSFRERYGDRVALIDTTGWREPGAPVHPCRQGHEELALLLTEELRRRGIGE